MTQITGTNSTFNQLDAVLHRFVARFRKQRLIRQICVLVASMVLWLILFGFLDRVLKLSGLSRGLLLAGLLVLFGLFIYRILRQFLRKEIDLRLAAAEIERREPSLTETLQTAISQRTMPPSQRGSEELTKMIENKAATVLQATSPAQLLPTGLIYPAIAAALTSFTCFGVLSMFPLLGLPRLIARQLLPFMSISPVTTTILQVQPGNMDLPEGDNLTVHVSAQRLGDDRVMLLVGPDAQSLTRQPMIQEADGRYVSTVNNLATDLVYKVTGGDNESPLYMIRTLRRPVVRELRIHYEYPSYLGWQPHDSVSTDGHIEAPRGTKLLIGIVCSEAIESAQLLIGKTVVETEKTIDSHVRNGMFTVNQSGPLKIELLSDRSVKSSASETMQITCIDDRPPVVQFMRTDLRLHPNDVIALPYQVIDDYGVTKLTLTLQQGETILESDSILPTGDTRLVQDVTTIDLARHKLEFGDVVNIKLTAVDGAGQERSSEPCRVLLSPRSVDPRALRRVEAIAEALRYSQIAEYRPEFSVDMQRALLRVVAVCDHPATAELVSDLIEKSQFLVTSIAWSDDPDSLSEENKKITADIVNKLDTLYRGEQSNILLADAENIRSMEQQRKDITKAESDAMKQSLQRARQEWASKVNSMKLDPNQPETKDKLTQFTVDLDRLLSDKKPWNARALSEQWKNKSIDVRIARDCVAVASQVQVLRCDSDLIWARDLQLVARAMVHIDDSTPAGHENDPNRTEVVLATDAMEIAHVQSGNKEIKADERSRILANAESARNKLRELAGENLADATRTPYDKSLEQAASMDEQMAEDDNDKPEPTSGAEVWQPPGDGKGQTSDPAMSKAQKIGQIAKSQSRLNRQTDATDGEHAESLANRQKEIAQSLKQMQDEPEEDFFNKETAEDRSKSLQTIRDVQQALANLPQDMIDVHKQAEALSQLRQITDQTREKLSNAQADDLESLKSTLAAAQQQQSDAEEQLTVSAQSMSAAMSGPLQALQAQLSGGGGSGGSVAQLQKFDATLKLLSKDMADAKMDTANASQTKALDAVAQLQSTLRNVQRQIVQRDPIVSAKFFAEEASRALVAQPPKVPQARDFQKQTSESLDKAWDAALAKGFREKLQAIPAYRSLLLDEVMTSVNGTGIGKSQLSEQPLMRQWGRLRRQEMSDVRTGSTESPPAGYEEPLRIYFDALEKSRAEHH